VDVVVVTDVVLETTVEEVVEMDVNAEVLGRGSAGGRGATTVLFCPVAETWEGP